LQNSFAKMLQYLNFNMGSARYAAEQMERQNKELAKAMHLVEEADRQKIKFVQNVTHQIRTPLNIIMGFAQVWSENLGQLPEEEMKSIVSQMDHNAKSLNRMVLMLVDSSETGSALALAIGKNQEPIACNVIAREAIGYTNEHFPDLPIQFRTTLPDTFTIRTNHLYLMRSLRELLYNAAKYSDRQHVSVRLEQSGNNVRFIVEDTGPGISEEYREVMYDIFTKVDDLSEGLGLGLPLAKRHISNLGGEFIFDTDYHDGCRFIIELPTQNN
jgi:signal transduction histidine kinase